MTYLVDCDSCAFERETDDEVTAYDAAKEHESDYADHFVCRYRSDE